MSHSLRPASTRSRKGRATIALALLLLGGCSDSTGPDAGTSARQRWARNRPAHYSFTLARGCFCLDEVVRPVVVEVRDGAVLSRTYAATGEAVDARWVASFPSIDGLLAELDDAAKHADRMQATYDREYGYPQHAYIDYAARVADDEMEFTVSNFHPLP
jgi:hypothetical protein